MQTKKLEFDSRRVYLIRNSAKKCPLIALIDSPAPFQCLAHSSGRFLRLTLPRSPMRNQHRDSIHSLHESPQPSLKNLRGRDFFAVISSIAARREDLDTPLLREPHAGTFPAPGHCCHAPLLPRLPWFVI